MVGLRGARSVRPSDAVGPGYETRGAEGGMIQYDPHPWLDHLFDVKGSLIPEITLRVLSCFTSAVGSWRSVITYGT